MAPERVVLGAALAVALAAPGPAHALVCGTFLLPITVTATSLALGSYNPGAGAAQTSTSTITVRCSSLLDILPNYSISLSSGTAGSYAPRQMAMGAARLNYNIYKDGGYATVWGDGTGATQTQTYSTLLLLGTISFTAHGRIPTGQYVQAGAYTDTITVTVTY